MKVVILCGGMGTRAYPYTTHIPKALMPVSGLPIVEQVMRIYADQGFDEFVLAGGYLKEDISRYFEARNRWNVQIVDTGDTSDTGERVRRCLDLVDDHFHATYCDGLGDVDLHALANAHLERGGGATMTTVQLRSQYGIVEHDEAGRITGFLEKPVLPDRWINAGFFVFERDAYERAAGDNLERDVLPRMSEERILHINRHYGFWRSMDTFKDQQELDGLWAPFSATLDDRLGYDDPDAAPDWLIERYQLVSEGI
ncbi:MAG TPA: sugar phosphate nucleotidyltransferase [Acidimicrobiia bacterium]|nr:sugar phosphate nucleotidyltransferase [Acidimicrobiia bacterium]